MDCKATSTDRRRRSGLTVVELLFAVSIGVIVLGVFTSFALYQSRSFLIMLNLADMDQANRNAVDRMSMEIRQVNKVIAFGTNYIDFEDSDKVTLTYRYSEGAGTLSRTKAGDTTVLLREVVNFNFVLMQRNIVEGDFAYYPAESLAEAKVIEMVWDVSRSVLGKKSAASGTQIVRAVIRKA